MLFTTVREFWILLLDMLCLRHLLDIQVKWLNRHLDTTVEFKKEVRVGNIDLGVSSSVDGT